MYYVATALIGFATVLVILFFPETFYPRSPKDELCAPTVGEEHFAHERQVIPPRKTYFQSLALYTGIHTTESLLRMFLRPLGMILIPTVLWGALVMSVTIGFLVAVTSNLSPAFEQFYGMQPWQTGLCNIAAVIGSLIGIWVGGTFSDIVADFFTKRNGGIREPEFRLPAMAVSMITGPLALVFYGVGINNGIHWIMPTIGLGLLNFTIVQATNVSFVYCLDSYKPIAGIPPCSRALANLQARLSLHNSVSSLCSVSCCRFTRIRGFKRRDIPGRMVPWLESCLLSWFVGSPSSFTEREYGFGATTGRCCDGFTGRKIVNLMSRGIAFVRMFY